MGKEDKKEPFLTNLGRATMRGLRRCQKCGTLNGTRGYSCKNKFCDVVFKEVGGKKKSSTEPCKIHTGTSAQIYSVRVRDKGPDYRGFVQLPPLHANGSNILLNDGFPETELLMEGARCFVESCHKLNKYTISPHPGTSPCNHIKAATQCYKDAQPLSFKNSVLNSLPIPTQFKEEMYQLATDTSGPLVQRVSKSLVVVKCSPHPMHPLGFLHFSFIQTKVKKEGDHKFYCSCRAFKFQTLAKESYRKCVHLYACIVAFASDDRLAAEFACYIDLIKHKDQVENLCLDLVVDKEELEVGHSLSESETDGMDALEDASTSEETIDEVKERSYFILNDSTTGTPCQVEVEVVRDDSSLMDLPISASDAVCTDDDLESKLEIQLQTEDGLHLRTSDGGTISVHQIPDNISISSLKRNQDESVVQASSALLTLQKSATKKIDARRPPSILCSKRGREFSDDVEVSLTFSSWLASVSERINQSMHYGFSGKPDPLVFHLPKSFFSCLIVRINKSIGSKKRKLVHETQNFIRKDAVPLGKFTKFTWKLTTLVQVQEIFSNKEVPLEVVRYFSLQKDGSYKPCKMPQPPPIIPDTSHQSGNLSIRPRDTHPIRPREYKTVLRVGTPCPILLRDPTPFVLEWIPDILPKCHIGELRLKFEYDHYCNGQLVPKQPSILLSKALKSSKSLGPPLAPRPPQNKALTSTTFTNTENLISFPLSTDNLSSGDSITVLTF